MAKSDIKNITVHSNKNCRLAETEQGCVIRALLDHAVYKPVFKSANDDEAIKNKGPYDVDLSIQDRRLVIGTKTENQTELPSLVLSLTPYRRIITDYFMMIDSYETARRNATRDKLEAIDMARRGIHNEGAELLINRLTNKIELDFETGRRFFSLICFLQKSL